MRESSWPLELRLRWLMSRRALTVLAAVVSFFFGILAALALPV